MNKELEKKICMYMMISSIGLFLLAYILQKYNIPNLKYEGDIAFIGFFISYGWFLIRANKWFKQELREKKK